jgi:hypothetical protein
MRVDSFYKFPSENPPHQSKPKFEQLVTLAVFCGLPKIIVIALGGSSAQYNAITAQWSFYFCSYSFLKPASEADLDDE